jgi:hypothetical protein
MNFEIRSAVIIYSMFDNSVHATVLRSFWEAKVNETWSAYITALF